VAPNKIMLCVSFRVPAAVAFAGRLGAVTQQQGEQQQQQGEQQQQQGEQQQQQGEQQQQQGEQQQQGDDGKKGVAAAAGGEQPALKKAKV
jgi:hypothetical protein